MKEINLGRILVENRHKRGITQDELAAYMGVSKAAVSKWEWTGDGIDCVIQFRQPAGAEQKDLYTICLYNDETYAPQY